MNVSRQLKIFFLTWVFSGLFALSSFGQSVTEILQFEEVNVIKNTTWEHEFYSATIYGPKILEHLTFPNHGTAELEGPGPSFIGIANSDNTLLYTPDTDFIGRDTLKLLHYESETTGGIVQIKKITTVFEILVAPSFVWAVDDYANTELNTPVEIDVLYNDFGNGSVLSIQHLVAENSGWVEMNAAQDQIIFHPNTGFEGIANFNYTICDDLGTCDMATVNVEVVNTMPNLVETYEVFARKNQDREILYALDGYSVDDEPNNGSIEWANDVWIYAPVDGAIGMDQVTFSKVLNGQTYLRTVEINILDIDVPNVFAFDDRSFTTLSTAVEIDALKNDLNGYSLYGTNIVNQASNGTVVKYGYNGNAYFVYTPDAGFDGVDKFTYKVRQSPNSNVYEIATAYITVSNQAPSTATVDLSTPANTPLVIAYNVPITDYSFAFSSQPATLYFNESNASFHPGYQEVTMSGQTFEGYNMLIYNPGNLSAGNIDEFEVEYNLDGASAPTSIVKIKVAIQDIAVSADQFCLGDNCVWAGDTNSDGVVNMADLLPIGLCMGEVGQARSNTNLTEWYGQYGIDWENIFEIAPFDVKHVDANGDGVVAAIDTSVISAFYNNQHSILPVPTEPTENFPLIFEADPGQTYGAGDMVHFDIYMGKEGVAIAEDIYGFSFSLELDNIEEGTLDFQFVENNWLNYNSPVLHMSKAIGGDQIDAGLTRTSGLSDSGYGIVAALDFVIIEDLEGGKGSEAPALNIRIHSNGINSAGETASNGSQTLSFPIDINSGDVRNTTTNTTTIADVKVFPNPSMDYVNVYLNGAHTIESLSLFNVSGQEVSPNSSFINANNKGAQLDIRNLNEGVYFIQMISSDGELISKKFEIIK